MGAEKTVVVVMGVAGSGKSTVAERIAQELGWTITESDDLHSPENVAKMAAGIPLTDDDREPWLGLICRRIEQTDGDQVVACSALRRRYRDILRTTDARVRFLHLEGSRDLIGSRLDARTGHFMLSTMLQSQLATLEPLDDDEDGASISIDGSLQDILRRALAASGSTRKPLGEAGRHPTPGLRSAGAPTTA